MAQPVEYHYDNQDAANTRIFNNEEDEKTEEDEKEDEHQEDEDGQSEGQEEDQENMVNENGKRKRAFINWKFKCEFDTCAEARELLRDNYKDKEFKINKLKSGTKVYFACKSDNKCQSKAFLFFQPTSHNKVSVFVNDKGHDHVVRKKNWGIEEYVRVRLRN